MPDFPYEPWNKRADAEKRLSNTIIDWPIVAFPRRGHGKSILQEATTRNHDILSKLYNASIIVSPHSYTVEEDWSEVRSPGRARRRRAQGHPQRIKVTRRPRSYRAGDTLIMHPTIYYMLLERVEARIRAGELQP